MELELEGDCNHHKDELIAIQNWAKYPPPTEENVIFSVVSVCSRSEGGGGVGGTFRSGQYFLYFQHFSVLF